jgi:hypothetical protein
MTKSDSLQLPLLLSTAADKKLPAGRIKKTFKKPANADPARLELKLVFKQTDEIDKKSFSSCNEEREREERV